MTSAILRIKACIPVSVGMKVYYDCPSVSTDDRRSNAFFSKYKGKEGTIVSLGTEYVGILDVLGRLPGLYFKTGSINVQFDGEDEVYEDLRINHFVLLSPAEVVVPTARLWTQRAGDLPQPIQFYPGDEVNLKDDLFPETRIVSRVKLSDDGSPVYVLLPSAYPSLECSAEHLELVKAGNLHWLYVDPSRMKFASDQEEAAFWARNGLSRRYIFSRGRIVQWEYSLEQARALVAGRQGDFITKVVWSDGDEGDERYSVRRLHDCLEPYRERVRRLSQQVVPLEDLSLAAQCC